MSSLPQYHRMPWGSGGHARVAVWAGPSAAVQAPPVVLVHGFMGSIEAWGDLPARLARTRSVIVPDLPGHGDSDGPRSPAGYEIALLAGALGRVVDGLTAAAPDWVGYSMGGRVVLAGLCEGLFPARRAVVESASPGLDDEDARRRRATLDDERAARLERVGLPAFVDDWMALPLFDSQRGLGRVILEKERARRLRHDPALLAACIRGASVARQRSYWGPIADVRTPLLVLTGQLDERFEEIGAAMAVRCPAATRRSIAGVGHAIHLEAPGDWLVAVERHLGRSTES